MANSNTNDQYYACLEKCLFEPLFLQYSSCNRLDLACACGHGVWDQIYGCTQGTCGSYKSQISASAQSYCSVASQIPSQGARTVTVTASGTASSVRTSTSYATTTITSLPTNAASISRISVTVTYSLPGSSTTATSAPNNNKPEAQCDSTSLGVGAVAGIAAGSLLVGIAIALLAACLFFRGRNNKRRNHVPELQQPSVAYRAGAPGQATAPLLPPITQPPHGSDSSLSGVSTRFVHGPATLIGRGSNERLGSPAPSYSPEQKYGQTNYQQLKGNGGVYADHNVVEHDGRERAFWSSR